MLGGRGCGWGAGDGTAAARGRLSGEAVSATKSRSSQPVCPSPPRTAYQAAVASMPTTETGVPAKTGKARGAHSAGALRDHAPATFTLPGSAVAAGTESAVGVGRLASGVGGTRVAAAGGTSVAVAVLVGGVAVGSEVGDADKGVAVGDTSGVVVERCAVGVGSDVGVADSVGGDVAAIVAAGPLVTGGRVGATVAGLGAPA